MARGVEELTEAWLASLAHERAVTDELDLRRFDDELQSGEVDGSARARSTVAAGSVATPRPPPRDLFAGSAVAATPVDIGR